MHNPKHPVDNLLKYLPTGTLADYLPKAVAIDGLSDEFPVEVGLSGEVVGANLDTVVAVIEFWLRRKLGLPLDQVKSDTKPL